MERPAHQRVGKWDLVAIVGKRLSAVQRDPEGNEYGFRGEFREVVPPERLVFTFEYEGMPGHILQQTITFAEHDGKTTVSSTALFDSVEERAGMLASGMESGATESWDRLAEFLERLR